jgi:acetyl-CoA carboxylase biotin carboxyl carrier protein
VVRPEAIPPKRRRRAAHPDPKRRQRVPAVEAQITGTIWKIECAVGDRIEEDQTVAVLESMKMEMPVESEYAGRVTEILCREGEAVNQGQILILLSDD